jgi:type I restriction enzyme S subunit
MIPNTERLPEGWHRVRFDRFLNRLERKLFLDDVQTYNCAGVRWYGMGAFLREQLTGSEIKRKQQWMLKAGDVVYNKLFAWKGSFAVADTSVDGCIVSDKFPTYEIDPNLIDSKFLSYFFRTAEIARQAQNLSKGAAAISKLTLNPPQFWDLTIPLPPLAEQRRIVARIETVAARIAEARGLRREAVEEAAALISARISCAFNDIQIKGHLGDVLLEKPRNGWSARCDNLEGGTPVLTLSAVTGFQYRENAFKRTSEITSAAAHYWLQKGDLLITRSNTPELVGHAAIYNGKPNPCIYPDLMMKLVINHDQADINFVHRWLQSTTVRDFIRRSAKGTSPTMKKISQAVVSAIPFPSQLSSKEQRRIVAHLDALQAQVDALKALQAVTSAELDALLPALLDKAFRGEL